jgi:1-acyl-sn-glycerol-3-phosphate acyltransferase
MTDVPNKKLRRLGYGEKLGFVWSVAVAVLYPPVSLLVKMRYRNMERLPQQGPAIVVVNHISHVDPFLVGKFVLDAGRTPRFLAKRAIFDVPVVGAAMRSMGHIPVERDTTDAAKAFKAAVATLQAGGMIVLHPEGTVTRDPDGWPMEGKSGAARLATLVPGVPVVPVTQWGVQEQVDIYTKRVKLWPRPKHLVSVGEPIDLSAFDGEQPTVAVLNKMTDVIMLRLREDVAELRDVPAPAGPLYHWVRPKKKPRTDKPRADKPRADKPRADKNGGRA